MKKILLALLLFSFPLLAVAEPDGATQQAFKQFYKDLNNLELEIAGTGYGHIRTDLPGFEGKEAWCFGGIPMYDKKSRLHVGYANDCLMGVINEDGSISVNPGFTFFDFFAPNGEVHTLMVSGGVSVQPVTVKTQTSWGMNVTHITGSSASDTRRNNTCVGGSGPFDGASCVSRISGMVDMSNMDPANIPGSTITFSCFFAVEGLRLKRWAIDSASEQL